ncbi:MAG: RES family NAD+ phosphorylase [Rhodobacteraceae bacterium]|nr:RES family NAD+ phosphorylase [Paracoccaceae bacterium]
MPTTTISGLFYRIVFTEFAASVLEGVRNPEGRYHHDGEPAIYLSPTPEWAAMAIDTYLRPGDAPRVIVPLRVADARICDLRDATTCAELDIDPEWPSVPWQPERAAGKPATSWRASDAVRRQGADGMIYRARSYPDRWHLVLFRWNTEATIARVSPEGAPSAWSPVGSPKVPSA